MALVEQQHHLFGQLALGHTGASSATPVEAVSSSRRCRWASSRSTSSAGGADDEERQRYHQTAGELALRRPGAALHYVRMIESLIMLVA